LLVDVAVLSGDTTLFETIKAAVGDQNPVWRARSAEETVDLLLSGRCGVLLIDMGTVSTQPATLIEQIVAQFPAVVVVVAGRRDDEALLARLISDGLVYRFIHKPATPKRAGMFVNAAIRHHVEQRESGRRASVVSMPFIGAFKRRFDVGKWSFVATGVALFVGIMALSVDRPVPEAGPAAVTEVAPPKPVAAPPRADPVLSRARAALAAGRLESPPGRNALDLFHAVLLAEPGDREARAGLAATIKELLRQADAKRRAGKATEARRLVERIRSVDRTNPGVALFDANWMPPAGAAESPVRRIEKATPTRSKQTLALYGPAATVKRTSAPRRRAAYGAPVAPRHATAGYERTSPAAVPEAARAEPAEPAVDAFRVSAGAPINRDIEQVSSAPPAYPPEALAQRVEGWVEVEFTVTASGNVAAINIAGSEPSGVFDQAAIDSVGAWRFNPRLVNGKPVPERTSTTVRFTLEE
jgi:protein TonB